MIDSPSFYTNNTGETLIKTKAFLNIYGYNCSVKCSFGRYYQYTACFCGTISVTSLPFLKNRLPPRMCSQHLFNR